MAETNAELLNSMKNSMLMFFTIASMVDYHELIGALAFAKKSLNRSKMHVKMMTMKENCFIHNNIFLFSQKIVQTI